MKVFVQTALATGILICCLCCLCSQTVFAQGEVVRLSRVNSSFDQYVAAKLLTEIYKRAGLVASIEALPGLRATKMVLSGEIDGEVARVDPYASLNPGLIKLTPSFYYATTAVFSKLPLTIKSKEELKNYKVGVMRGALHSTVAVDGVATVQIANNADTLFAMLDAGRFDVVVDTGANGSYTIAKKHLKDVRQVGELSRNELFNILSPNKKYLAPRISAVITEMKNSGELESLTQKYKQELLQSGEGP